MIIIFRSKIFSLVPINREKLAKCLVINISGHACFYLSAFMLPTADLADRAQETRIRKDECIHPTKLL